MFDQRGVGFSEPALDCPETTKAINDNINKQLTTADRRALNNQALEDCHTRLVKAGVNLAAYNSAENAADVEDLRVALGYKAWNLYGISYGTRLALTVMRDFPDGVRSVILDSTLPLQVDLYSKIPADADRAFKVFFQACLDSRPCNAAYPNLDKAFYELVAKLDKNPVTINAKNPYTGKTRKVLVDGDIYVNILYEALYSTDVIIILPQMIWQAHNANFKLMERIMGAGKAEPSSVSEGMYFSVQCAEQVSFDERITLENATKQYPKLGNAFDMASYYDICQTWNVPQRPDIEKKAVTSDIPTLVLAGEYDPITPPGWGYLASQTLKHSFYLVFPGVGHGVSIGDVCPYRVTQSFLKDPSVRPDIGCMSVMAQPRFITK
jgi:pimeloyl-ACP methyl ester carboxylesterase